MTQATAQATSQAGTRVMVVEDHPLAREGLKAVLANAGYDVIETVATGEEAVEAAASLSPDVVLMDLRLGSGIDGLEATRRIAALGLPTRVLMLTLHDTPGYVREALEAGAAGYVLKDTGIDELRQAIAQVLAGGSAVPLELITQAMQPGASGSATPGQLSALTDREREVVALVGEGLTNKEIARRLSISPATVKVHVERIIAKLGVADRTQAAVVVATSQARSA